MSVLPPPSPHQRSCQHNVDWLCVTLLCCGMLLCGTVRPSLASDASAFFASRVEPLLKEKCQKCHSHAGRQMEGGLTLDSKSGWQTGGDRGPAIIPGNPEQSLLVAAVRYDDSELQMPPDEKLSDDEIDILVQWIRRGAVDPRSVTATDSEDDNWWSLRELVAPAIPANGHPIDAFINAQLNESGITPVQPADRVTLVRRLYVDLFGYLPLPEEISTFLADDDALAYQHLVDRLLASPQYGERWARHWLDVIHFADSHGCEHDVKRPHAWRYRDYVIARLNADVSWSDFIREQLAPDVFFPEQPHLMAGLGFIAAGPLELSRAGTAPVTFDYLDRDDIVTQTMAAFVSTTANCARCHTHKFDPITQEDYYSLQAVFAGVGKGDIDFDVSAEVLRRRSEMERFIAAADALDASVLLDPAHSAIVTRWENKHRTEPVDWHAFAPEVFVASSGSVLARQDDASVLASGDVPDQEHYTVSGILDLDLLGSVRLEVLPDPTLPMNGPGRAANGNLHLSEVDIQWFPPNTNTAHRLAIAHASADFDQDGWTSAQAIDGDLKTGWAIFPNVNQAHHIVFELENPLHVTPGGRLAVSLKQLHPPKHLIGRFRLSVSSAAGDAARVLPASVAEALAKPAKQRSEQEATAIAALALRNHAEAALAALPPKDTVYGVSPYWSHAKKLPVPQPPKTVHVLRRGAFDQPVREVGPGAIEAIGSLTGRFQLADPQVESLRRAALADWLAHHDNPLTWRSIVNRVWHFHFGRGLCDTPNDLGRMGSQPTHPQLLDWLAVWFRDEAHGSLKALHRLILTSDTWKRASQGASQANDSENRLLWRMNRRRMEAEVVRDSVLRISDRLDLSMGGPGVEQFFKTAGQQATPRLDYSRFDWRSREATRRSIYRVVWRGIPDPFMEAMDFPDLGILAPKRGFSVSPLQSLAMFNNDFVLHGSEWFAERVERDRNDLDARIARAVQLVWLRPPTSDEQVAFTNYVNEHGMAAFCRVLLNSNAFLFVD